MSNLLLTVLGPTASGKTAFAANIALMLKGEIISADSRQVYKNMDIGTGKDIDDYTVNNTKIPYHLIDIVPAGEKYNVYQYQKDCYKILEQIKKRNILPVLCGGTGMYIEAVIKKYNLINVPENTPFRKQLENKTLDELKEKLLSMKKVHNISDFESKKRLIKAIEIEDYYKTNPEQRINFPEINPFIIGLKFDRQSQRRRITERLKQRLETGMLQEVENLLNSGISAETLIYYGLEYKFITNYLIGSIDYDEMFSKLNIAIHQFAKRQMTWFRRMEKNGMKIHWFDGYQTMNERLERLKLILEKI